ncbi:MAG: hypothetical protein Q9160_004795 [Pyrenula sp. 1 TL-2023]
MPSTLSHTTLESLLVFQSVASRGATGSNFDSVSTSLNQNEIIRRQERYDAARLGASEIENLYKSLLEDEARRKKLQRTNGQNGFLETTEPNSRKRKLSPSVSPTPEDVERNVEWMAELANRLYAKYKENIVAEIKSEEEQYRAIAEDIRKIEAEPEQPVLDGLESSRANQDVVDQRSALEPSTVEREPSANNQTADEALSPNKSPQLKEPAGDGMSNKSVVQDQQKIELNKPGASPIPALSNVTLGQDTPQHPTKPTQPTQPSPRLGNQPPLQPNHRSLSPAVPASAQSQTQPIRNGAPAQRSSVPPTHGLPQTRFSPIQSQPQSPVILPPPHAMPPPGMTPMRPPSEMSASSRRASGTPNPAQPHYMPPQHPYAQHHSFGYPPWPNQPSPHNTYPHLAPYSSPYHPQQVQGSQGYPPSAASNQSPYPPYGYAPYGQPPTLHRGPPPVSPQTPQNWAQQSPQPGWPAMTPVTQRRAPETPRTGIMKSNSPWKSMSSSITQQMPQPAREREVSPVEERVEWLRQGGRKAQEKKSPGISQKAPTPATPAASKEDSLQPTSVQPTTKATRGGRRGRRGRATSAASSAVADRSRSESATSFASDTRQESSATRPPGPRSIKPEPPSTPAPLPSDSEQTRISRRRGNTLQSLPDTLTRTLGRSKRGQNDLEGSPIPPLSTPRHLPQPRAPIDSNLVATTRNFSKISQTLMQEVLGHKHAGIFAKPITERDLPGYRDLVYYPQDLKSIKAAISAGNKAVAAAIEEQGVSSATPGVGEAASPTATPTTSVAGKNATLLLKKTPDLVPPKAIVNSGQLEKELIRMFANAIMSNPLPREERGFGNIRLGPGGVLDKEGEQETADVETSANAGIPKRTWKTEEGRVVRDSREMAEAVEKAVTDWRDVEQGPVFGSTSDVRGSSIIRGASVTASEALGAEESAREEEADEGESNSGRRKRRKVAE